MPTSRRTLLKTSAAAAAISTLDWTRARAEAETLRIGVLYDLTGPFAAGGSVAFNHTGSVKAPFTLDHGGYYVRFDPATDSQPQQVFGRNVPHWVQAMKATSGRSHDRNCSPPSEDDGMDRTAGWTERTADGARSRGSWERLKHEAILSRDGEHLRLMHSYLLEAPAICWRRRRLAPACSAAEPAYRMTRS